MEVEFSHNGLMLNERKTTGNVESQPPLRSRQGQILEDIPDFKYLGS